ncbi:glycosyltransferase [Salinarimonas sp.]|uniref:glycosyltransferase n=1 Tax=Salinarimonas sp. TaxID=2766526 RepID=UPI0032D8CFAB
MTTIDAAEPWDAPEGAAEGFAERPTETEGLLIYASVPLYRQGGVLFLEDQACNGLRRWADNFGRLVAIMPVVEAPPPPAWIPVMEALDTPEHIRLEPVPTAYRPDQFMRHFWPTRRRIRRLILEADYLAFGIGGLFGDWGSVACLEASRLGRAYAVCTDRVESEVTRFASRSGSMRHRLRTRLFHRPMAMLERAVVRRAGLGMFHGRETYNAFAPFCRQPEVIHDIHWSVRDHIDPARLLRKRVTVRDGPLRLVYAGRADAMKGPYDWVEALARLRDLGVDFRATWLGDGTELEAMRTRIAQADLADRVETPGFVRERAAVLEALRDAHAFAFCHLTPESPRCLVEALISGCPIIGYEGAYAADLIAEHGGGRLVPRGDVGALASTLASLDADRDALADLIARASRDGRPHDDISVFRHRSELIKRYLPPPHREAIGVARSRRAAKPRTV